MSRDEAECFCTPTEVCRYCKVADAFADLVKGFYIASTDGKIYWSFLEFVPVDGQVREETLAMMREILQEKETRI